MRLPTIQGVIDRRVLVNYRLDPAVAARVLPQPFHPKMFNGYAVAGICLIRLREIRPAFMPTLAGVGSENSAHRFAVEWEQDGKLRDGVYIPRRDSSSRLNAMLGGRIVPGEHHHARFDVAETDTSLRIEMQSDDGEVGVHVEGEVATALPARSIFPSLGDASRFFESGSLGYSATKDAGRFDGLELRCRSWVVQPLGMTRVESSYFDDSTVFPAGSATFDCALLMRDVEHEWHSHEDLCCPAHA